MEPFLKRRWNNFVDPIAQDRSLCDSIDGQPCPVVTPVIVNPPIVDPPDDIIVIPVPSTGIVNPVIDVPVTNAPTILQPNTPTPTTTSVFTPIKVTDIGDPILDSAVVTPVTTTTVPQTATTPAWFPGMFGSGTKETGGGATGTGDGKTNLLSKYKNYFLLAALIATVAVVASKSKKSKK